MRDAPINQRLDDDFCCRLGGFGPGGRLRPKLEPRGSSRERCVLCSGIYSREACQSCASSQVHESTPVECAVFVMLRVSGHVGSDKHHEEHRRGHCDYRYVQIRNGGDRRARIVVELEILNGQMRSLR